MTFNVQTVINEYGLHTVIDMTLPYHRIVTAALSEYMRARYTDGTSEGEDYQTAETMLNAFQANERMAIDCILDAEVKRG